MVADPLSILAIALSIFSLRVGGGAGVDLKFIFTYLIKFEGIWLIADCFIHEVATATWCSWLLTSTPNFKIVVF